MMRAAALLLLLAGATLAQTDCVFCPNNTALEIDFDSLCATVATGDCAAPWAISSDAQATAKAALGCSIVGSVRCV